MSYEGCNAHVDLSALREAPGGKVRIELYDDEGREVGAAIMPVMVFLSAFSGPVQDARDIVLARLVGVELEHK